MLASKSDSTFIFGDFIHEIDHSRHSCAFLPTNTFVVTDNEHIKIVVFCICY